MTEKPQAERSLLTEHGVVKAGHSHRRARNELLAAAVLLALMPTLVHRSAVDTDAVIFNALARTTQGVLMECGYSVLRAPCSGSGLLRLVY